MVDCRCGRVAVNEGGLRELGASLVCHNGRRLGMQAPLVVDSET